MHAAGRAISVSRLSVMTGLHRPDVIRLYKTKNIYNSRADVITRIIGQWQSDKRFTTTRGKPRALLFEGKDSEFAKLVCAVSADLNPYTALFELERMGTVERTSKGLILQHRMYLPRGSAVEGFELLSRDAEDLISA